MKWYGEKLTLLVTLCGVGALAFQAALFKQIQELLLLSEAGEINGGKGVTFLNLMSSISYSIGTRQEAQLRC